MKSIHLNIPSHKLIVGNNTVCLLLYVLKQNVYIVITSPELLDNRPERSGKKKENDRKTKITQRQRTVSLLLQSLVLL